MSINHLHDRFFKETFSRPDVAKALLEQVLPEDLACQIDLNSLRLSNDSFVDQHLEEHFADLIYRCELSNGQSLDLAFLLEHKSYPEKRPHLQLLRYVLNAWEANVKAKDTTLTLFVPIIVFHGKGKWVYAPLESYFGEVAGFRDFIPEFRYLLYDLSALDAQKIKEFRNTFFAISTLLMKYGRQKHSLAIIADQFSELLNQLEPENNYWETAFIYLVQTSELEVTELFAIFEKVSSQLTDKVMSTYEKIISQGRQAGHQEGRQEGKEEGIVLSVLTMYRKGFDADFIAGALDLPNEKVLDILKKAS